MKLLRMFTVAAALTATLLSPALLASEAMLEEKQTIDGYTVTFHSRPAQPGQGNGRHDVMIKIEKAGKVVRDVVANSKVIHPNHQPESKMMMAMGDGRLRPRP